MHRSTIFKVSLASLVFPASTFAATLISTLSFGFEGKISPNGRAIPEWNLAGEGHIPQILSDRVILTPPSPGHARSALWADAPCLETEWHAELEFRAGGQERGSGNLQIWYAKDGRPAIGSNSVYTVPSFDGLVLTIDQHDGKGTLRGFLNDGTTNYKDHHLVDSLAFGHCDFNYRNQGYSSKVKLMHGSSGLEVTIDGRSCFAANQVKLPEGYYFGLTAATADNPDSFEVNAFIVTKPDSQHDQQQHQDNNQVPLFQPPSQGQHMPNAPEQLPDTDASSFQKQQEQFADLHNRLQGLSHQINNMFGEFDSLSRKIDEKHNEIVSKIPLSSADSIGALTRRVEGLEKILRGIEKDLSGRDYSSHLQDIHKAVEGVKGGLSADLPDTLHQMVKGSAPKLTTFIVAIVMVQLVLAGVYYMYKMRRNNAPKKYL